MLWKRIAFDWQVSKRLYWNSQDSELFQLCLPWKKGVRNTCVQVENQGMKIMFPPIGFQYLASEVQLEGKDRPLPALTAFSSGAPIPPQSCQARSGQQAFSLCPNTESAFLRSILRQWSPKCRDWKCTPSVAECSLSMWAVPQLSFPSPQLTEERSNRTEWRSECQSWRKTDFKSSFYGLIVTGKGQSSWTCHQPWIYAQHMQTNANQKGSP